jgi:hypothetical protein
MKRTSVFLFAAQLVCGTAYAAGCEDYPFTQGINVEDVSGGTGAVANVVGIRRGAISGNMSVSAQAARSIG